MKNRSALILFGLLTWSVNSYAACLQTPAEQSNLRAMPMDAARTAAQDERLQSAAVELLDCLANTDPAVRDDFAFSLLSQWMRANAVQAPVLLQMQSTLIAWTAMNDAAGFRAPFAALTLAEIARVDRLHPYMDEAQRNQALIAATIYMKGISDYRGYDASEGWRHGVAHGADWLLQLALNPAVTAEQQRTILQAVASQILADGVQIWRFGEGARLARPALYAAVGAKPDAEAWQQWLSGALAKMHTEHISEVQRLNYRHNAREFLWPLYIGVNEQGDESIRACLLPALREQLQRLQ